MSKITKKECDIIDAISQINKLKLKNKSTIELKKNLEILRKKLQNEFYKENMNKLIDLEITNNKLILKFENGGYIKITNLNHFDYQIKNCDFDINYLKFFSGESGDYRFVCASNGHAILIDVLETDFQPDNDDNWHDKLYQNISNFLKNNFIIHNVKEYKEDQDAVRNKLSNVFDEIKKEEIEKTSMKNELFVKENINVLLTAIRNRLKKDEFNFVIAYFMGNYDFVVLKDGSQIKTTASLKTAIRNYIENEITKIFKKYQLDDCVCNLKLIQEFCPFVKSKRLTYKVEAEQIGRDHEKRWQISNFSFQQLN